MEFKKNDYVTVTIEDIGNDGEGIGKVDGFTLFIKDAVIGDTVQAKIVKSKKHYAYARLEKVITPSPFRVEPRCAYHRQCGGCQIQALSYEKQLEFKEAKIRNNLIRIGGFDADYIDARMEPIVGMEEPYHYRNKAQYPVGTDKNGNIITGFYAGHTHSIIANTDCHLGVLGNKEILEMILDHMRQYGVTAYDETTGQGLVRHVLIRTGFTSGEIMVCIVINKSSSEKCIEKTKINNSGKFNNQLTGKEKQNQKITESKSYAHMLMGIHGDSMNRNNEFIPAQGELLAKLSQIPGMTSISVSINTENTNVIMGTEIHTLWGSDTISDTIHVRDMQKEGYPCTGDSLTFHISPLSFYQVNPVQTEKLYSLALEYAGLTGREIVWDLYCGIGTISLFLAGKAGEVRGVEIIPQAIDDAQANAKHNGITNAIFHVGKAEEVLPEFYENKMKEAMMAGSDLRNQGESADKFLHPDVIVVDPPRKGCDTACLNTMLQMQPERIVYVSCDSATLARDLRILCDGGYEIQKVRGVDQFGHTVHVETVCLLSKLNTKQHIEINLDMDELDLTDAEKKATYQEIKDYVLEHSGLKVSSLYIAQVKQKCGIIERENYNKPKSEDAKQPQCPPDKEKAIKEALTHFGMI